MTLFCSYQQKKRFYVMQVKEEFLLFWGEKKVTRWPKMEDNKRKK